MVLLHSRGYSVAPQNPLNLNFSTALTPIVALIIHIKRRNITLKTERMRRQLDLGDIGRLRRRSLVHSVLRLHRRVLLSPYYMCILTDTRPPLHPTACRQRDRSVCERGRGRHHRHPT